MMRKFDRHPPDNGQVIDKLLESGLVSAEGWPLFVVVVVAAAVAPPALRSLAVPAVDKDRNPINEDVERDRGVGR
jgi:hypothetical protein